VGLKVLSHRIRHGTAPLVGALTKSGTEHAASRGVSDVKEP